jgi:hypothetical protein
MGALTEGLQGILSEEMITAIKLLFVTYALVFCIVGALFAVLYIIAIWRIFKKANRSGWNIFIPIIGTYRFYKIAGAVDLFWKIIFCIFAYLVIIALMVLAPATMGTPIALIVSGIILVVTSIRLLIISLKFCSRLSNAFGHGFWFTLGLIFFPGIFILILAFGRFKYRLEQASGLIYKD